MDISLMHLGRSTPQVPVNQKPTGTERAGEREKELESERQLLQNQVLLMKSASDASAGSSDAIEMAERRLEEIAAALSSAAPESTSPAAETPRARFDEYVPQSEEAPSPGIYAVERDGEGGYQVSFQPYSEDGEESEGPHGAGEPPESEEKTTVNTDKVDAEIAKLKRTRDSLEQQLRQAEEGAQDAEKLRQQLKSVEAELSAKDNDTYRKRHATSTTE